MISLQDQISQLLIGIFLGFYISITYNYFNHFFSSKSKLIRKNIYDFLFIIFDLLLLISFLERNTHGVIRFYSLLLFVLSFIIIQIYLKDKLNKDFVRVYILVQITVKYIKKNLKRIFISKTSVMLLNRILRAIDWIKSRFSTSKNRDKNDNPI